MINFENVSKFIISDLSLNVPKGQVVGVIGDTGSGKTTFVKLASGLLLPESGRVSLMHRDPLVIRGKKNSDLGVFITGVPFLSNEDSVFTGMDMIRTMYAISGEEYKNTYKELAESFGFKSYEHEKIKNLSAGQRRRVELAAVMSIEPKIVILDEPDVGLDAEGRQILDEYVTMKKKQGVTFLITSHNLTGLSRICDRIMILSEGKCIFYGSERTLRYEQLPINKMTVSYDGPVPSIDDLPIVKYTLDENELVLEYNSRFITASEILNVLMKQTKILDIKISKPDLEQIIIGLHNKERRGQNELY